LSSKDVR